MMIHTTQINDAIEKVQRQLSAFDNSVEIICLPHKTGRRKIACQELKKGHQGEDISPHLNKLLSGWITDDIDDQTSEFLGTIKTTRTSFGGLKKKTLYLNYIALNVESYNTIEELEFDLFRLCWNICNIVKNVSDKNDKQESRILIPKPKGLRLLGNNLQADIFASLMFSLIHGVNYVSVMGKRRAREVIETEHTHPPENHPFVMTLDQTEYIYKELSAKKARRGNLVEQVWAASKVIIKTMNQEKLSIWQKFAKTSQDMAWQGFPKDIILSIAVDGNDDIETKKLAVQISALTGIEPASSEESAGYYNPYKSDTDNAKLQELLTAELFENLLTRSIFENSAAPFYEKADEQNARLRKGQFMGWCAHALQEAADVFDKTLRAHQPPTQTVREIFKAALLKVSWQKLKMLGENIMEEKRLHGDYNDRDFITFLESDSSYRVISGSVIKSARKNPLSPLTANTFPAETDKPVSAFNDRGDTPPSAVTKH